MPTADLLIRSVTKHISDENVAINNSAAARSPVSNQIKKKERGISGKYIEEEQKKKKKIREIRLLLGAVYSFQFSERESSGGFRIWGVCV